MGLVSRCPKENVTIDCLQPSGLQVKIPWGHVSSSPSLFSGSYQNQITGRSLIVDSDVSQSRLDNFSTSQDHPKYPRSCVVVDEVTGRVTNEGYGNRNQNVRRGGDYVSSDYLNVKANGLRVSSSAPKFFPEDTSALSPLLEFDGRHRRVRWGALVLWVVM